MAAAQMTSVAGSNGNDTQVSHSEDNKLYGGRGADPLIGGIGDDMLQGEEGNATILGRLGRDAINNSDFDETDQIDGGESTNDVDTPRYFSGALLTLSFTGLETSTYAFTVGRGASGTFTKTERFEESTGQDTFDFVSVSGTVTVTSPIISTAQLKTQATRSLLVGSKRSF